MKAKLINELKMNFPSLKTHVNEAGSTMLTGKLNRAQEMQVEKVFEANGIGSMKSYHWVEDGFLVINTTTEL